MVNGLKKDDNDWYAYVFGVRERGLVSDDELWWDTYEQWSYEGSTGEFKYVEFILPEEYLL